MVYLDGLFRPDRWPSLQGGNHLLNGDYTWGEDRTHWNKGIGGSLPPDRSMTPSMGYISRRVDLTG